MSNTVKSLLHFFNDLVQGREAGNSAIREFESDNNYLSISFIRELIQNAIDAWNKTSGSPVRLVFRIVDIENKHQKTLKDLFKDIMPLVKLGISSSKKFTYSDEDLYKKALVVEEFNTIGLTGEYNRKKNDESSWHYSNYLFGVNRGTKIEGGGSAGVGKITSNMVSELRSILFITSRSDDEEVWAGGRVEFEAAHVIGDQTFDNCAFLSNKKSTMDLKDLTEKDKDDICMPVSDKTDVDLIKEIFQLKRTDSEYGTSWIMPAPLHETNKQKKEELTSVNSYKKIILQEYSWAIIEGLIEIDLDGILINKETVIDILEEVFPEKAELWNFLLDVSSFPSTKVIRLKPNWFDFDDLSDAFITEQDLEQAVAIFESEDNETLGLKLPLSLVNEGVSEDTYFHLYIQKAKDISGSSNELVIRDYLPISGVSKSLSGITGDAVNTMILITEEKLVKFCRSAEQADHTDFVIKRAAARGYSYKSSQQNIRAVKGAIKKVYQFFNNVDIHDEDLLSDVFSITTRKEIENKETGKKKKKKKRKTKNTNKPTVVIKKIHFEKVSNSEIRLSPGPNAIRSNEIPMLVNISILEPALLGGQSNILNYGADGFSNTSIKNTNITIKDQSRDKIEFEITDPDFELNISNLDITRTVQFPVEY